MAFDPSMIKKRIAMSLPEGASREDRVLVLAQQLEERGLANSPAAAKRLAEGMVETEQKVIGQGGGSVSERAAFQQSGSALFTAAAGSRKWLDLPQGFRAFVERSAHVQGESTTQKETLRSPPPVESGPVMFDDAPTQLEPRPAGGELWDVPEKTSDESAVAVEEKQAAGPEDLTKKQDIDLFDVFKTGD